MSKPFGFEKPIGMRDTLPLLYETKKTIRENISTEIRRWGYQFIETPALEYYDTVGSVTAILEQQLFKLLDQQGKTLVLRPDMTAPIARVAASGLKREAYPLRLAYDANVFRAQQREGGRPAEFEDVGIELIGDGSSSADAEVIALMIRVLQKAGLRDFRVAIGHVGYVNLLLSENSQTDEQANECRRFLYEKNYVGYEHYVKSLALTKVQQENLLQLLQLRGEKENITAAKQMINCEKGKQLLANLSLLAEILDSYGVSEHVKIDFTLVSHMNYYTGIVFEAYDENVGYPISNGGRYDELLGKFDRPGHATGFGIRFDRLVEAAGMNESKSDMCCVMFNNGSRNQALTFAEEKRQKGEVVVLQDVTGVSNLDAFKKRFSEVVNFIDKGGKEGHDE